MNDLIHQEPPQTPRQSYRRHRTCRQSWSRVPVCPSTFVCLCLDGLHDLILALELLLLLKAARVLAFSGINNLYGKGICLCLMARGQQRSAQTWLPDSANIVHTNSTQHSTDRPHSSAVGPRFARQGSRLGTTARVPGAAGVGAPHPHDGKYACRD